MAEGEVAYRNIANELRRRILSGKYKPGQKLPTEAMMRKEFDVSQTTIRLALAMLVKESLVYRRRGSGSFVSPRPVGKFGVAQSSFYNNIQEQAPNLRRVVKEFRWIECDEVVGEALGISPGGSIFWFRRCDWIGRKPMSYDDCWISGAFAHKLTKDDLLRVDFFEHWQELQEITVAKSAFSLEAIPAGDEQARLLKLKKSEPVLLEISDIFQADELGTARFVTWYRHDSYKYTSTIHYQDNSNAEEK